MAKATYNTVELKSGKKVTIAEAGSTTTTAGMMKTYFQAPKEERDMLIFLLIQEKYLSEEDYEVFSELDMDELLEAAELTSALKD